MVKPFGEKKGKKKKAANGLCSRPIWFRALTLVCSCRWEGVTFSSKNSLLSLSRRLSLLYGVHFSPRTLSLRSTSNALSLSLSFSLFTEYITFPSTSLLRSTFPSNPLYGVYFPPTLLYGLSSSSNSRRSTYVFLCVCLCLSTEYIFARPRFGRSSLPSWNWMPVVVQWRELDIDWIRLLTCILV